MSNLKQGTKCRIHCPSKDKWPAFHKAFHGKPARVFADLRPLAKVVRVDVSKSGETAQLISVAAGWLTHTGKRFQ